VQYLEQHPKTAVTGPVVYNEDSTIQSAGASISLWTGKVRSHKTLPTQPTPVDCIVGNCFMMRTQAIKEIGQLTEKYFAYYEEADWCLQAKQHGWNCVVVPMAKLTHAKANNFRTYFIARNMVWFMKKFASPLQLSYFFCYYFTIFFLERLKKGSHLADLIRASQAGWLQHL
jgi:GT2 family glycosyltransferase